MNRIFSYLVVALILSSCGLIRKNNVLESGVGIPKTKEALLNLIRGGDISPEWTSLNSKIKVNKDGKEIVFSAQIRVKKDSLIWVSVKAPLGIEIFRALITQDSVYYMNRMNKTYFVKAISKLKDVVKADITYNQLQNILFASPKITHKKLKLVENPQGSLNSKTVSYIIHNLFFRVEQIEIIQSENIKLKINFYNYKLLDEINGFFPNILKIEVHSDEIFAAEINYTKIEFNKKQNLLFKIPSSYVEAK
tara:strand:+ start:34 stop:783 length:750 start_codon:yes stop_codon:yes gene_type:complete